MTDARHKEYSRTLASRGEFAHQQQNIGKEILKSAFVPETHLDDLFFQAAVNVHKNKTHGLHDMNDSFSTQAAVCNNTDCDISVEWLQVTTSTSSSNTKETELNVDCGGGSNTALCLHVTINAKDDVQCLLEIGLGSATDTTLDTPFLCIPTQTPPGSNPFLTDSTSAAASAASAAAPTSATSSSKQPEIMYTENLRDCARRVLIPTTKTDQASAAVTEVTYNTDMYIVFRPHVQDINQKTIRRVLSVNDVYKKYSPPATWNHTQLLTCRVLVTTKDGVRELCIPLTHMLLLRMRALESNRVEFSKTLSNNLRALCVNDMISDSHLAGTNIPYTVFTNTHRFFSTDYLIEEGQSILQQTWGVTTWTAQYLANAFRRSSPVSNDIIIYALDYLSKFTSGEETSKPDYEKLSKNSEVKEYFKANLPDAWVLQESHIKAFFEELYNYINDDPDENMSQFETLFQFHEEKIKAQINQSRASATPVLVDDIKHAPGTEATRKQMHDKYQQAIKTKHKFPVDVLVAACLEEIQSELPKPAGVSLRAETSLVNDWNDVSLLQDTRSMKLGKLIVDYQKEFQKEAKIFNGKSAVLMRPLQRPELKGQSTLQVYQICLVILNDLGFKGLNKSFEEPMQRLDNMGDLDAKDASLHVIAYLLTFSVAFIDKWMLVKSFSSTFEDIFASWGMFLPVMQELHQQIQTLQKNYNSWWNLLKGEVYGVPLSPCLALTLCAVTFAAAIHAVPNNQNGEAVIKTWKDILLLKGSVLISRFRQLWKRCYFDATQSEKESIGQNLARADPSALQAMDRQRQTEWETRIQQASERARDTSLERELNEMQKAQAEQQERDLKRSEAQRQEERRKAEALRTEERRKAEALRKEEEEKRQALQKQLHELGEEKETLKKQLQDIKDRQAQAEQESMKAKQRQLYDSVLSAIGKANQALEETKLDAITDTADKSRWDARKTDISKKVKSITEALPRFNSQDAIWDALKYDELNRHLIDCEYNIRRIHELQDEIRNWSSRQTHATSVAHAASVAHATSAAHPGSVSSLRTARRTKSTRETEANDYNTQYAKLLEQYRAPEHALLGNRGFQKKDLRKSAFADNDAAALEFVTVYYKAHNNTFEGIKDVMYGDQMKAAAVATGQIPGRKIEEYLKVLENYIVKNTK